MHSTQHSLITDVTQLPKSHRPKGTGQFSHTDRHYNRPTYIMK